MMCSSESESVLKENIVMMQQDGQMSIVPLPCKTKVTQFGLDELCS